MESKTKYFHAFNLTGHLGPAGFKKLIVFFKSLKNAWTAPSWQLKQAGLKENTALKIKTAQKKINPDHEIDKLAKENIDIITILDKDYPLHLKEIYNPPALLYIKGFLTKEDDFSLGIVGTRKLSTYGQQITPYLTSDLSQAGLTIVSGLARGIDTLAHRAALKAGGRTIAVLGCGLSDRVIYPSENKELAHEIVQSGAVISEFPPNTTPMAHYFPMRNRIISGLSLGTLVIEAPEKSGALITSKEALEQNREVFAVPGSIYSQNSIGPNNLIKMGAKLVNCANDILEELNLNLITENNHQNQIKPDNHEEALILQQLSHEPLHIDKIILNTKLTTASASSVLSLMEVKGKIRNLGSGKYVLAH